MNKYQEAIDALETLGKFDEDVVKPNPKHYKVPDENFSYDFNFGEKLFSVFIRGICITVGPLLMQVMYRFRVKGRKHLKDVKGGAITICNHVLPFDSPLMVREAVFGHRLYCTMAPTNNKKGFGGLVLKAGGGIPFGTTMKNQKDLMRKVKDYLAKGHYVNFHPEHGYWLYYQKPRPMYRGAFYYAIKNDVPVIPMFLCIEEKHFIRRHHVTLFIGKPIYPKKELDSKSNEEYMMNVAKNTWDNTYKNYFHVDSIEYLNQ